jgi:hypothetical protein
MRLRSLVLVAVSVLLFGSTGFAQDQRRAVQSFDTVSFTESAGSCAPYGLDFEVLNDWVGTIHIVLVYDQQGQLRQRTRNLRTTYSLYYNSNTPANSLLGGPGESITVRMTWEDGQLVSRQTSGGSWRVNLPGQGLIFGETGLATFDPLDPFGPPVTNTGHNQYRDGDLRALCDALK